jgi:hypothetical protein
MVVVPEGGAAFQGAIICKSSHHQEEDGALLWKQGGDFQRRKTPAPRFGQHGVGDFQAGRLPRHPNMEPSLFQPVSDLLETELGRIQR